MRKKPDSWPGLQSTANVDELYEWVEEQLDLDPNEVDAADAEYSESFMPLKASERAALLESFDRPDGDRWRPVLTILRSGDASPGMMSTIADLIEKGGFTSRAGLGPESHDDSFVFHEYGLIEGVIRSGFPDKSCPSDNSTYRMATKFTARLLEREVDDVRAIVKRMKPKGRGQLGSIRWRVATDPIAEA